MTLRLTHLGMYGVPKGTNLSILRGTPGEVSPGTSICIQSVQGYVAGSALSKAFVCGSDESAVYLAGSKQSRVCS